jgi:hypothetical protein
MADAEVPVVAVLVEPAGTDSGLAKSWRPRGNGRPPLAWKGPMGWDVSGPPYLQRIAVPLWWDGAVVGAGWDLARRFLAERGGTDPVLQAMWPTVADCRTVARQLVAGGFATRVVELYRDQVMGLIETE